MKIVDLHATPLALPAADTRSALEPVGRYEYGIVRIETDEGIEGVGEICTLWDGKGWLQCGLVNGLFRQRLIGRDPTAINACLSQLDTLVDAAWPARAGVEMALVDITGKLLNVPASALLGGRVRDSVELSRSIFIDAPEAMGDAAAAAVDAGFGCLKVKLAGDRGHDLAALGRVRESIPGETLLRVDANMAWPTAKAAIREIRLLEPFEIHSVEQPIPPGRIDDLRLVRESVAVPIMADESVWGPPSAWAILTEHAADFLNVYVCEAGGLTNAALIFRMAELAAVPCVVGAMPEFGIGTAASVHLAAAMTNLGAPCDAAGVMYQSVDIVNERIRIEDGRAWPPDGPGLGVTLDEDAIARFTARHLTGTC